MLRDCDLHLITIVTPHNTHSQLALQCLRAGRHVVCEKPFALTTGECDRMIAESKNRRCLVTAFHNRHWDGCILEVVRQIGRGAIGQIVRIQIHLGSYGKPGDWWRSSRSISGGIFYDWGVHFLEYALQLIEAPLVEVSGFRKMGHWARQTVWKDDTNEDDAFLVARFASGQWLTLCASHIDAGPSSGLLQITGTKGTYILDHNRWQIIRKQGSRITTRTGPHPPSQWMRFYDNVVQHLTKGTVLAISPEWARRPIHIFDLARRSATKGRAMRARYG